MGRMIEFFGAEGSGKTTTTLDIVSQCQKKFKEEGQGRKVVYVDSENSLDSSWAQLLGVNLEEMILVRPQTQTAEEIFDIMQSMVETGECGLLVLDSVATLVSQQIYEESYEKKAYGGIAASLTMFCNKVVPLLAKYNCMCIMINQVREDIGSMFPSLITPGGKAFKHHCSVRLSFQKGQFIDKDNKELTRGAENPAGNLVMVSIAKTKTCKSNRRVGFYTLNYTTGIDSMNDIIDVCLANGVIVQNGSYFTIIDMDPKTGEVFDMDRELKVQGRANLNKLINEDEYAREIVMRCMSI